MPSPGERARNCILTEWVCFDVIKKREKIFKIPGADEWAGYKDDPEGRQAHSFWFGKSLEDVQKYFGGGRSIQRAGELLFMPRRAFQFYIFAFAQFVMSEAAIGDADAASSFLNFLTAREKRDPGSVAHIYDRLQPAIEFVAESQVRFDAGQDVYGDFRENAAALAKLCGKLFEPPGPLDEMLDPTDDA
jgi:hypothetical protein